MIELIQKEIKRKNIVSDLPKIKEAKAPRIDLRNLNRHMRRAIGKRNNIKIKGIK